MQSARPQADPAALRARLAATLPASWRTRFAPAPTGHLHLGHAVNAVYVWSIAQAYGGSVIVRIEDHDQQRSRAEFESSIRADLAWLGLVGDNLALGLREHLRQSDDDGVYQQALTTLSAQSRVYACRCSRRDIAQHTDGASAEWYPGTCRERDVPPTETQARRLIIPDTEVRFTDLRHGALTQQPATQCGDLLLRDRRGLWTYQFAVVVDDQRQGVNVIIRGDDLLESTGRQWMLAQALGRVEHPLTLHHPLVSHADGSKLSKSRGDTGLGELRSQGWDAARVLGHAAWLGGLQPSPEPISAEALGTLWAPRDPSVGHLP